MDTAGDLERFLENYRQTVLALCLRVLRHRQDAEDACQETLLKLARQRPSDGDPMRLAAWVHQVALRTAIDHHRAKTRRKAREERAAEQTPSQALEADSFVAVAEALSALPEEDRTLLVDHFFGSKTLRALASEQGCSEPAVWKRVEKSKDRLRKALRAVAPAAVLALNGFLEAAERPARGMGWRLALVAAVPAIVMVGLAGIGFQRRHDPPTAPRGEVRTKTASVAPPLPAQDSRPDPTATSVRSPEASQVVPPYPYEIPPRHWPEAKRAAWLKLDRIRLDLSAENILLHEILADLSARSGILMRLAPDLPVPTTPVTFKVKDLILKNTLGLLLGQFDMVFDVGSDGSLWMRSAKGIPPEPDPRFEEIQSARKGLAAAFSAMDNGTKGVPVDLLAILRSKEVSVPPGNYALGQVVERLRQESGLKTVLAIKFPTGDPELHLQERDLLREVVAMEIANRTAEARALSVGLREVRRKIQKAETRPFQGGIRTLEGHLREVTATWNVGWAPGNGTLLILDCGEAAREMARAEAEQLALIASTAQLDQPALKPLPTTLFQLTEALSRGTGLKVVPSEKAWAAAVRASGETWKTVVEKLPGQGFRWLLRDGTIYIDR